MTNDIFSLQRFGKYLSSDLRRAVSSFGISFCIVAALPLIDDLFTNIFKFIFTAEWGGQPFGVRLAIFVIALVVMLLVFPSKCYGYITERKAGTSFSMVPASVVEKTVSMLLLCCVIMPVAFILCYGAFDALVCLLDHSCGKWIFNFGFLNDTVSPLFYTMDTHDAISASLDSIINPALYIDDMMQWALIFLLGALCFKNGKIAKTFLMLIIFGTVCSLISSPFFVGISKDIIESGNTDLFIRRFEWIFRNLPAIDTISDTVVNIALCVAIFFRVKTIKH